MWRPNNLPLKHQWVNDEIKEEIKNTLRQIKMKTQISKSMGCNKNSSKRKVHSYTGFPKEVRKVSNNLTYHLKDLEKEEHTKAKAGRRKKIIKIREEIIK